MARGLTLHLKRAVSNGLRLNLNRARSLGNLDLLQGVKHPLEIFGSRHYSKLN